MAVGGGRGRIFLVELTTKGGRKGGEEDLGLAGSMRERMMDFGPELGEGERGLHGSGGC